MEELQALLSRYDSCISFSPLPGEASPEEFEKKGNTIRVPASKEADPFLAAEKARSSNGQKTYLLIPGTRFDAEGTRHGRGGGWYDRFLSQAPEEWLRIGICTESQFFEKPLAKNPWDEPMDYVAIRGKDSWMLKKAATPRISHSQR